MGISDSADSLSWQVKASPVYYNLSTVCHKLLTCDSLENLSCRERCYTTKPFVLPKQLQKNIMHMYKYNIHI